MAPTLQSTTFVASTTVASLPQGHSASFAPAKGNMSGTVGHLKEMQIERMEKEWCHLPFCNQSQIFQICIQQNEQIQATKPTGVGREGLLTMIWEVNDFTPRVLPLCVGEGDHLRRSWIANLGILISKLGSDHRPSLASNRCNSGLLRVGSTCLQHLQFVTRCWKSLSPELTSRGTFL